MYLNKFRKVERAAGIEPVSQAWKAWVITIIRCPHGHLVSVGYCESIGIGGGRRIRTFEGRAGRFTV